MPPQLFVPTQLLTARQLQDLWKIFQDHQPTPHKKMLAYIEDQPDLVVKLKRGIGGTEILAAYYAYVMEYVFMTGEDRIPENMAN